MSPLSPLLTRFHTAPGRPRLHAGEQRAWRGVLPVALVGLLFAALVVAARVGLPAEADPLAPFMVGQETGIDQALRERGVPVADELTAYGYDGQWFLGQAYDPLLRTDLPLTFDAPRYRSLRVLLPATGWLLAAGQPSAIPVALLAVQVLAVALGCASCARIVSAYRRSPWWGLTFAAIPGVLVGVAFATAEPLGLAVAALGVTLALDRRYGWAGLAFAGAALTKETYLAFALGTVVYLAVESRLGRGRWLRPAAAITLPGGAALLAWWGYVTATLPPDENNPYGAFDRFSPPLVGWWQVLGTIARGEYVPDYPIGVGGGIVLVASLLVLVAAIGLALWLRQSLLAYIAVGWSMFGLIIAGFLLERFLSAQRTLAPAVLAAAVFLVTVRVTRRTGAPATGAATACTGERPGDGRRAGRRDGEHGRTARRRAPHRRARADGPATGVPPARRRS
jgi:hypothetical protein